LKKFSEQPFTPPTNAGIDGDQFLFLSCQISDWFSQPAVQPLGHWPYVLQHICGIAALKI